MSTKIIAKNKTARRNYEILETHEAGVVLRGNEVKSLREAKVTIKEAYARFENGELWIQGLHITAYSNISTHVRSDPTRRRKLLMHRTELTRLFSKSEQGQLTIVPLALYFKDGKVKVEIGLARGLKTHDKRQQIAKKDADRQARREVARHSKGKYE